MTDEQRMREIFDSTDVEFSEIEKYDAPLAACIMTAMLAARSEGKAEGVGERRRARLCEMVALDEELEAKHPGWMTGHAPLSAIEEAAVFGRVVEQIEIAEAARNTRALVEIRDLKALIPAIRTLDNPNGEK